MTGPELQEMREAFGVTQEDLATAIGRDVRTLRRWERGSKYQEQINHFKLGRVICAIGKCNGNRAADYGAVLSPALVSMVDQDFGYAALTYGKDMTLIALSEGIKRRWPAIKHFVGSDVEPLLLADGRRFYDRYKHLSDELLSQQWSAVKYVSKWIINIPAVIKVDDCFECVMTFPDPGQLIMHRFLDITNDEYLARVDDAEFVD